MLDTVRFNIVSDSTQCSYNGQVRNNSDNKQYVFNALFDGYVFEKGSGVNFKVYDAKDSSDSRWALKLDGGERHKDAHAY
mgnify:CR=1 FL=1